MPKFFSKRFGLNLRKSKRFSSDTLTLQVHVKPPLQNVELADISQGGLSFFYTDRAASIPDRFDVELSDTDGFDLGRVTLKKISDEVFSELPNEDIVIRRLRGRFIRITVVQEYDLKRYLDKLQAP
jgi:hypothetical protein